MSQRDNADLKLGRYDIFFKKPYQILYNVNDLLIALWFLVGSIFFLFDEWKNAGVWLFILGSGQLGVRPLIRIIHSIHLNKHLRNKKQK
ncbi:YrhK family protein [Aquibacillus salsiterrae]|uniref:YrhK family protein n=1 Tax=Aquibacillus salsiterrae TaxID=2950439 RepID=A0A9X4AEH2_9BACI|nr:YrhK family protein [Aquibacillus salsiterrae]MDC3416559.1 YrhK family protein [Aquibacillus salsiterrae]